MTTKKLYLFAILFPIIANLNAIENNICGARSLALGGCSVALSDTWAVFNNQGILGGFRKFSASIYHLNHYQIKNLSHHAFSAIMPIDYCVSGLSFSYFGLPQWHNYSVGIAMGKQLFNFFSAGIKIDYINTNSQYVLTKSELITFEIGVFSKINENISLGIHTYNPIGLKFRENTNIIVPLINKAGINWQIFKQTFILAEIEKESGKQPEYKTGVEWALNKVIFIRTGISDKPMHTSFGLGLKHKNISVDTAFRYHSILGYSPSFALSWIGN